MIEQRVGEFTRKLFVTPGFHWVRENPHRNFGNGSVKFLFALVGEKGAVEWQMGTEWMPEAAREDIARRRLVHGILPSLNDMQKPRGNYLGYHSPVPMYDGQEGSTSDCAFLGGKTCFTDASYCVADELIEGFLNGGDEWIWNRLEAYYRCRFEGAAYPDFTPIIEPHPDDRPQIS